jgi:hypothetical protein
MFSRRLWPLATWTRRNGATLSSLGRMAALIEAEAMADFVASDIADAIEWKQRVEMVVVVVVGGMIETRLR